MKPYSIVLLTILLFLYNCDEQSNTISNHISEENLTYNSSYADFKSLNDGLEKYSINLTWGDYLGADFTSYEILDSEGNSINTMNNQSATNTTIGMNLNEFKEINFLLNTQSDQQDISTITVFTRPVSSITNFIVSAYSTYNQLSWTSSTDTDIEQVVVYRASLSPESELPLINNIEGNPNPSVWNNIAELTPNISSYTDNDILIEPVYYYIIKIVDTNGGYNYSYMNSNIAGAVDNGTIIGLNNNYNISLTSSETLNEQIFSDKILFSWNEYSYNDFYKFEVWKSENETFDIGDLQSNLIATITNQNIATFKDYNDVGNNKTWYYQIRLYNIYGNYLNSEIIECNTSL